MRALVLVLLAGCNQILGSEVTGPNGSDDDGTDGGIDDGAGDGRDPDDGATDGSMSCAWTQPAQIAPAADHPSIAVSGNGVAHVVFDLTNVSLGYMSRAPGQSWSAVDDLSNGVEKSHGTVAIDSANTLHLIYTGYLDLSYEFRTPSGSWSAATEGSLQSYYAKFCALAVGPGGPNVGCSANSVYAGRPGGAGSWQLNSSGESYAEEHPPGIAISSTGELLLLVQVSPPVAGTNGWDDMLKQVTRTAQGGWQTTDIDKVGYSIVEHAYGDINAIAVDGTGTQHIVFTYGPTNNRRLKFRRRVANSVPGPRELPDENTVAGDVAAVLEAGGSLHVVYQDLVHGNLRYVRRSASGSWTASITLDAEGGGNSNVALAIGGGTLHVIWTDAQGHLFHATRCT